MLLIFRLFFFAIGLAVLAVALLARGLVPEPAFNTRIGEVPSLSRPLIQQAIIVPTEWERRNVTPAGGQAGKTGGAPESTGLAETVPPVPASPKASAATRAGETTETSRAAYVSPVIWSQVRRSDPLTELKRAARAGRPELTLTLRQVAGIARGPAAVEPPALAFGIDEPASEDGADAGSAEHRTEASKPAAAGRQAKAGTPTEATAKTKAQAKAPTGAKAAASRPAKASKAKYRRKSVRRGRTTRASKRRVAARSVVRPTRKKAKRARSAQRAKKRARQRRAQPSLARRTTRTSNQTYVREPADGIYRFEPPRPYRYYLAPQYGTNRANRR